MVISVEQMRKSDAYTIEHLVPGKELMYRAATGVYESYNEWAGKRIAIVVGGGNNGGDGYALAVESDLTVSIGYIKQGLVTENAKKYIKSLVNVDIGIVLV